jgi:predicted ATPase
VVGTSQRPLGISGERIMPLGPLPLPAATALFARRAAAVQPAFALGPQNVADIETICQRVECLPLAIELAAARVRLLSPAELVRRLDRQLRILVGGARDRPDRHRSLRAAIESSLEVVGADAVTVFRWLGGFAGGGQLADVEAVARTLGRDESWLLDAMTELVDASLVRAVPSGGATRHELPDAMAELAGELLKDDPERYAVRAAVADRYLDLVRASAAGAGPATVDRDAPNIRAAIGWAIASAFDRIDATTVEAIYRYYERNSRLAEGQRVLTEVGAAGRAAAWVRAGQLAALRGDLVEANRLAALAIDTTDLPLRATARMLLGQVAAEQRDLAAARANLRSALVDARRSGDIRLVGRVLNNLCAVSFERGRLRDAERQLAAALEAKRRGGAGPVEIGRTLYNLAEVALAAGDYPVAARRAGEAIGLLRGYPLLAAQAVTTRALALLRTAGPDAALAATRPLADLLGSGDDRRSAAVVELRFSVVLHAAGQFADAARLLRAALPSALDHTERDRQQVAGALELHAWLLARRAPAAAASLLGAAGRLRQGWISDTTTAMVEHVTEACRAVLGAERFAREYGHGAGLHRLALLELSHQVETIP